MDTLNNRIRTVLPHSLSEIGDAALESFLALPCATAWHPSNLWMRQISMIFDVGLPFALLGSNLSAEAYRQEIGNAIANENYASLSCWSELQAGALLSNWGAKVTFIKRVKGVRTPDLEADFSDEAVMDVEVTRGEIRQLHTAVKDGLENLAGALVAGDVDWNVICFFADASNAGDINAAFNAAIGLSPYEIKEEHGHWAVRAVPLEQRDDVVRAKMFAPEWWPSDEPDFSVTSTLIGTKSSPVIAFRSLIPMASYMNPIRSKADRSQGNPEHPYLIALDTSEMPRAHERIIGDLNSYFANWNHVSGVMLFESRFWVGVESKEWIVSIHANPHAHLSLPGGVARMADGKRHSVRFVLSNK